MTAAVPWTVRLTTLYSSIFSSNVRVGTSPVVPVTTRPSLPVSTRCWASRATPSRSTERSSRNGVTMAVRIRPNGALGVLIESVSPLTLELLAADQLFSDLHGIQGGTLAQVVGHDEHEQRVRVEWVLSQPSDVGRVLTRCVER